MSLAVQHLRRQVTGRPTEHPGETSKVTPYPGSAPLPSAAPLTPSIGQPVPPAAPAPGPRSSPASSRSPRSCLRREISQSGVGERVPPPATPALPYRTRLEVAVDDALAVEVAQPRDDLPQVVPHLRLRQAAPSPQDVGQALRTEQGASSGPTRSLAAGGAAFWGAGARSPPGCRTPAAGRRGRGRRSAHGGGRCAGGAGGRAAPTPAPPASAPPGTPNTRPRGGGDGNPPQRARQEGEGSAGVPVGITPPHPRAFPCDPQTHPLPDGRDGEPGSWGDLGRVDPAAGHRRQLVAAPKGALRGGSHGKEQPGTLWQGAMAEGGPGCWGARPRALC